MTKTPLVNALTDEYAGVNDAHHIIALDSLARRLEESHARLVAALERLLRVVEPDDSVQWGAGSEVEQARVALLAAWSLP